MYVSLPMSLYTSHCQPSMTASADISSSWSKLSVCWTSRVSVISSHNDCLCITSLGHSITICNGAYRTGLPHSRHNNSFWQLETVINLIAVIHWVRTVGLFFYIQYNEWGFVHLINSCARGQSDLAIIFACHFCLQTYFIAFGDKLGTLINNVFDITEFVYAIIDSRWYHPRGPHAISTCVQIPRDCMFFAANFCVGSNSLMLVTFGVQNSLP